MRVFMEDLGRLKDAINEGSAKLQLRAERIGDDPLLFLDERRKRFVVLARTTVSYSRFFLLEA